MHVMWRDVSYWSLNLVLGHKMDRWIVFGSVGNPLNKWGPSPTPNNQILDRCLANEAYHPFVFKLEKDWLNLYPKADDEIIVKLPGIGEWQP